MKETVSTGPMTEADLKWASDKPLRIRDSSQADERRDCLRVAAIIILAFVLACLFCFFLLVMSNKGYVFAEEGEVADCRTIELSHAQTQGARERLEALEAAERLNLLEYRLDLLHQRLRSLWDAATKDRLT